MIVFCDHLIDWRLPIGVISTSFVSIRSNVSQLDATKLRHRPKLLTAQITQARTSSILNDPKYAWRNPNQTVEEVFQFLRQMWFSYLSKAPKHTDSPPALPILSQFWFAQSCYVKVTLTVNYQEFERTEHFFPRSHVNQKCIHTTDTHAIIWVTPSWLMIVWSLQGGEGRGLYSEYASEWYATLPSERAFLGQKRRSLDKFVIIESSSF